MIENWGVKQTSRRGEQVAVPPQGQHWTKDTAAEALDQQAQTLREAGTPGTLYTLQLVRLNARCAPLKSGAGEPVQVQA